MLLLSTTGPLFDLLRSRSGLTLITLRKLFNSVAFFVPALAFMVVRFLPCHAKASQTIVLNICSENLYMKC